jgi:Mce-associated membrane protein
MNNAILILSRALADKEVAVPSFRRRASVIDAERVDEPPQDPGKPTDAAEALALAEEAEAEAAEAEAVAAAAGARARAIRLRRQAQAAERETPADVETAAEVESEAGAAGTKSAEAAEVDTETSDVVAAPAETTEVDRAGSDTEDSDEADVAEQPADAEPVRTRRRWRAARILKTLAATLAVACTAALVTLSVLMVLDHRHQAADQQRRAEYTAAARQSVVTLMSLDFNKAKEDVQRIIDNSTGQFRDDFKNQADDFIKVAQESKVVTDVTVNATAVESMTDDSATVLVSASSRVTNSAGAKQEPRSWRLSVDLKRDGGQIKMSKVEFVP